MTSWKYVALEIIGGIFDTATLGQFLFGIDPKNCRELSYNCFESENKGCDLWKLTYEVNLQAGKASIGLRDGLSKKNLYNIHVHRKLFKKILTGGRINEIIRKINE
jgi:hypothetical protein